MRTGGTTAAAACWRWHRRRCPWKPLTFALLLVLPLVRQEAVEWEARKRWHRRWCGNQIRRKLSLILQRQHRTSGSNLVSKKCPLLAKHETRERISAGRQPIQHPLQLSQQSNGPGIAAGAVSKYLRRKLLLILQRQHRTSGVRNRQTNLVLKKCPLLVKHEKRERISHGRQPIQHPLQLSQQSNGPFLSVLLHARRVIFLLEPIEICELLRRQPLVATAPCFCWHLHNHRNSSSQRPHN